MLVDARHGVLAADEEMFDLLDEAAVTYQIVLTKIDKLKPAEVEEVYAETEAVSEKAPRRLSPDPCHLEREIYRPGRAARRNRRPSLAPANFNLGKPGNCPIRPCQ